MATLEYIIKKYGFAGDYELPIIIKISRFKGFLTLLNELGFKVGAEIGVSKGRYARAMCQGIPGLKLYCVDPWEAYPDYVEQHDEAGQKLLNELLEVTKERLAPYDYEIIRKYSMDAVKDFKDESLDFVFIDGNHSFEYVVDDIAAWSKKVRKGGIVAGHDYWNSIDRVKERKVLYIENTTPQEAMKLCQVKDAVDGWVKANQIKPWFVIIGDQCPSWFWVRQ